jgi:hypothetical protein
MAKGVVWTDQAKADLRSIEQPIALQILKTLGRYVISGEGRTKQFVNISPPLIRLRARTIASSSASMKIISRSSAYSTEKRHTVDSLSRGGRRRIKTNCFPGLEKL